MDFNSFFGDVDWLSAASRWSQGNPSITTKTFALCPVCGAYYAVQEDDVIPEHDHNGEQCSGVGQPVKKIMVIKTHLVGIDFLEK